MTADFIARLLGMALFALLGGRLGSGASTTLQLDPFSASVIFALTGMLFGLVTTPWLTTRPVRWLSKTIKEMPIEKLSAALLGIVVGLSVALLGAYPLSQLDYPLGSWLPPFASLLAAYLGLTIFSVRSQEIWAALSEGFGGGRRVRAAQSKRQLLLDTSVLIDGRIVEIEETGFLGGTLLVPRFVLNELHQVADSSDPLRRARGRRGLNKLNQLQRSTFTTVKVIDDDVPEEVDVDNKLVALALQIDALVITNDYNLNRVAEAQGVTVLNINALANAVKSVYIPGETFPIHIIQEGRDPNQGIGYLEDGTMVVVENGKPLLDRTVRVTATKVITRDAGRMIFAVPENSPVRR